MRTRSTFSRSLHFNVGASFRASTSVAALALGLSAAPLFAQDTASGSTDEETGPTREIVVVQGAEVDGVAVQQILPVLIGGTGDLLFVNRGFTEDQFLTFNGQLAALKGVTPTFQLNLSQPFYSIDSGGNTFALATGSGIATGAIGSADNPTLRTFSLEANSQGFTDLGNLTSGASPLIVGDRVAALVSGVSSSDGDTENIIVYADALNPEFNLPLGFFDLDGTFTSLNFAGPTGLVATTTPLLASANSAETSTLLRLNISDNIAGDPAQVGPRGNPQQGTDFLRGGETTFAGFTFPGTLGPDGLATFGDGARFVQGEFSANSQRTAFVLDNALVGLDGSNSPDAPGQVLVIDNTVIALASTLSGVQNQTTLGEVNFVRFEEVLLADTGEVYFRQAGRSSEAPEAEHVGIWRIVNPGEVSQIIEPVLAIGDELLVDAGTLNLLFPESGAPADGIVRVAGFVSGTQEQIGNVSTDGRPRFISVNSMGRVAIMVQIQSNFGLRDALIAQDVDGSFRLVAFVGQLIDVEGPEDQAFITSIRAQFGSNDVDGAGDLYNSSDQLGFVVTLDDAETSTVEGLNAVLRVSLNGIVRAEFDTFLFDGACGDDEFFTQCSNNNFVNLLDPTERADELPGTDNSDASVVVRGNDIRIATADLAIRSLQSDSQVTLQEGRTLTLRENSSIETLVVQEGTVATTGGTLSLGTFTLEEGNVAANSNVRVTKTFNFGGITGEPAVQIDAGATIEVAGPDVTQIATVNVLGSEDELPAINGTLRLTNSSLIANTIAPLQIGGAGLLEATEASQISLQDGVIRGEGTIRVKGPLAGISSSGESEVSPKLEFLDTQSVSDGLPVFPLIVSTGKLSVSDTVFKRTGTPTLSRAETAVIAVQDRDAELNVRSGSTLSVENQAVRLQGAGTLVVNGTLGISSAGLLENFGTLDLLGGALAGEGVLINSGTIALGNQSTDPLLITNPFANLGNGTINTTRPLVFDISEQDASQTAISLTDLALEEVFGSGPRPTIDLGDIGLVLSSASDSTAGLAFGANVTVSGDSALALANRISLNGSPDGAIGFDLTTDALLAANISGSNYAAVVGGDQGAPIDIIIPKLSTESAVALSGTNSSFIISTAAIQGVGGTQTEPATFTNTIGSSDLIATLASPAFRTTPLIGNEDTIAEPSDLAQILQIAESSITDLAISNTGIVRFDNVNFVSGDAGPVQLDNSGLALFSGDSTSLDNTLLLKNAETGRAEFNLGGQTTNLTGISNLGVVAFLGEGATYNFSDVATNEGTYIVGKGASLINRNETFVGGFEGAGDTLNGSFVVEGNVTIEPSRDPEFPTFANIGVDRFVEIRGEGRIDGLDQNGFGLTRINGTFIGTGRYQTVRGLPFEIGNGETGAAGTFDGGLEARLVQVRTGSTLNLGLDQATDFVTIEAENVQVFEDASLTILSGTAKIDQYLGLDGSSFSVERGNAEIEDFDSGLQSIATIAGNLTSKTIDTRGEIRLTSGEGVLTAETVTVAQTGAIAVRSADIGSLTLSDASADGIIPRFEIAPQSPTTVSQIRSIALNEGSFSAGILQTSTIVLDGEGTGTGDFSAAEIRGLGDANPTIRIRENRSFDVTKAMVGSISLEFSGKASFDDLTVTDDALRLTGVGAEIDADTAVVPGLVVDDRAIGRFGTLMVTGNVGVSGSVEVAEEAVVTDSLDLGFLNTPGLMTVIGDLTAGSVSVQGELQADDTSVTAGKFEILFNSAPVIDRQRVPVRTQTQGIAGAIEGLSAFIGLGPTVAQNTLTSDFNVEVASLNVRADIVETTGALFVTGLGSAPRALEAGNFSDLAFLAGAGSFTDIGGNAFLRGGLTLGDNAVFNVAGSLEGKGLLVQGSGVDLFVLNNISFDAPSSSTPSTNTIEPNRSLARVMSVEPLAQSAEASPETHFVGGLVASGGSAQLIGAQTIVALDGLLYAGADLLVDDVFIEGFVVTEGQFTGDAITVSENGGLFSRGDIDADSLAVDGALITQGTLTATDVTVSGQLEFASAEFASLFVADGGMLIGSDFATSGDFTNLGTFMLGSLEDGPGVFAVDGTFINGGVFSGTGTLDGSLLQAAQDGGPEASELLFSPGFSPGILDITGDATFEDGMVFMEIGGLTPGTDHDQINVDGMLTFGSNAMLVIDLLDTDNGEPFLLGTGEEVVLFTANDISPDDIEDINLSILDTLPAGFALVTEIATTQDGEILRVLRGFNGSTLSTLAGLDASQAGVAGAIDFLSTSQSGVPSLGLFNLAVDLQFEDSFNVQAQTLTELGGTTLSALQSTALRAGRYNMDFMTDRLSLGRLQLDAPSSTRTSAATAPAQAPNGGSGAQGRRFNTRDFAHVATHEIQRSGGVSYLAADESRLSLVGSVAVHFGDQDSRAGTIGFDQDGWSASLGAEYETADAAFLFGLAATLGESDADLDGSFGETKSESLGFGLYTSYDMGPVRLAAALSAADLELDSLRTVQGLSATGESDGDLLAFHAEAFAPLVRGEAMALGPKVEFDWQDLEIDGFGEAGAGDFGLNLPSLDRKASAFTLSAVGDFGFDLGRSRGALHIDIGYQLTTAGDDFVARQVAFQPAPTTSFAAALRPLVNDGLRLRTGLTLASSNGLQIRALYDGLFAENGQSENTLQAQVRLAF